MLKVLLESKGGSACGRCRKGGRVPGCAAGRHRSVQEVWAHAWAWG